MDKHKYKPVLSLIFAIVNCADDNLSTVGALCAPKVFLELMEECSQRILILADQYIVKKLWIPGHLGSEDESQFLD